MLGGRDGVLCCWPVHRQPLVKQKRQKRFTGPWKGPAGGRGRRAQDTLLRVLLRAGGSSGAGWLRVPFCAWVQWHVAPASGSAGTGKFSFVFNVPWLPVFKGSEYWALSSPGTMAWGWRHLFLPSPQVQITPSAASLAPRSSWVSDFIPWLLMNDQAFPYNWVRQPCDLLPANFFFECSFHGSFWRFSWICKVVWEIWIIFHLFFEIGCFIGFFAVSHC